MTKIYYPYTQFVSDMQTLVQKIDKPFDAILCIARGGLTMGHFLGIHYDTRDVFAINSISYDDTQKLDEVKIFNIPDLRDAKSVLIVDDIVDSGDTLLEILRVLGEQFPSITFYTASIFYKKSAKISPTWYIHEATQWIEFFWEVDLKEK